MTAADPINTGAQAVDIKREEVTNNKIAIREGFILDRYCLVSRAVRLHLLHFTYETSIFMSLEVAHLEFIMFVDTIITAVDSSTIQFKYGVRNLSANF
ncbi:hypothetical protein [Parasutterella excrementihominis]|uniref:hypothetical protein n=1 Tax=Parasutterella excrementihominis TaxID=487175 RepID=UPI003A916C8F